MEFQAFVLHRAILPRISKVLCPPSWSRVSVGGSEMTVWFFFYYVRVARERSVVSKKRWAVSNPDTALRSSWLLQLSVGQQYQFALCVACIFRQRAFSHSCAGSERSFNRKSGNRNWRFARQRRCEKSAFSRERHVAITIIAHIYFLFLSIDFSR